MPKKSAQQISIGFDELVNLLAETFDVKKCSLMLLEEHNGEKYFMIKACVGLSKDLINKTKMKPSDSIIGNLSNIGEGILVENVEADPRYNRKSKKQYSSKSFICVPIKNKKQIFGLISLTDKKEPPHNLSKAELIELCTLTGYLFKGFQHPISIPVG